MTSGRYGQRSYTRSTVPLLKTCEYSLITSSTASHPVPRGFDPSAKTNPNGKRGNNVWLYVILHLKLCMLITHLLISSHLFVDSLAIQPCNPTFLIARSAWIKAEKVRYRGAYKCIIWRAFAQRGLGIDAKVVGGRPLNGFAVPKGC
jgi:extracellular elastinolytic metalloproteinase